MPFYERNGLADLPSNNGYNPLEKGFTSIGNIYTQLVADLTADDAFIIIDEENVSSKVAVLEAKGVDPLWADFEIDPQNPEIPSGFVDNQNWRIGIHVNNTGNLVMHWGTPGQLDDITYIEDGTIPSTTLVTAASVGRSGTDGTVPSSVVPWYYMLTTADRGFAFAAWGQGYENSVTRDGGSVQYSKAVWIQRLTNTISGDIQDSPAGKTPVFCVYSNIVAKNAIENDLLQQTPGFILSPVRDVESPFSQTLPGTTGQMNKPSQYILYTFDYEWFQPSTLDSYNHVIKFPFGIGTIRNIYLEEMDLMGIVYAGSFQPGQTADIDMFTPAQSRTYKAGPGNYGYVPTREKSCATTSAPPSLQRHSQPQSRMVILSAGDSVTNLNVHA